ncbi:9395_t:CDS:10 [Cetraspora pellucida]|uniref:9395_t:CDS:1 n=1 Tax=Cetraspora pellucida TaxID=1433469 RepID=A0ACA9L0D7_9GLOM|nr:9395_t:CDS:10 [Cetraspora pellucida]
MSDNVAHALSGAAGGIISMALTYPLITVSSRLQVQKDNKAVEAYKGGRDAIMKIIRIEGISGLYSGVNSAIFGIALTNGVYYYFYEWTKAVFEKSARPKRPISIKESMLSGAIAGALTAIITNPIWVVNTRMTTRKDSLDESIKSESSAKQVKQMKAKRLGTISTVLKIIEEDGIMAFWQGVKPALILVINPIIQYTAYEQLKVQLEKIKKLGSLDFFLLGAVSKLIATSLTYPYIVIKSRMQLRQSSKESSRYNSVMDGVRKIIQNEGVNGLYKGITYKLLQSVLTAAFLFMYKEAFFAYSVFAFALASDDKIFAVRTALVIKARAPARWYATETTGSTSGLRLSFVLPHQAIYKNVEVQQVNIAATSGDMGILASHVPSIEQLKPGVIEVIENANTTKKFFVSGGFAIINPNSSLDINAVEAFPLEEFSPEAIRANLAEAQRTVTSGPSEEERNIAKVEVEVLESLQSALGK